LVVVALVFGFSHLEIKEKLRKRAKLIKNYKIKEKNLGLR
jgi:hypothetical protein